MIRLHTAAPSSTDTDRGGRPGRSASAPRSRRTRRALGSAVAALALVTAACGSDGETETPASEGGDVREQVEVTGEAGAAPEVSIQAPLEVQESTSWTVAEGDGDTVESTSTTILQLSIYNGQSGEPAISTYDEGQSPQEVALGQQVFPSLVEGLVGQQAGSRVVVVSTGEDAYGPEGSPQIGLAPGDPVVVVADLLSTDPTRVLEGPDGTAVEPDPAAPVLVETDGVPTGFTYPTAEPPGELQVYTLVEGDGPAIEAPDRVTTNYLGQVWGADTAFDDSFTRGEPADFSVGLGRVIPAWDELLQGVTEGSRVLLVCPPDQAYGTAGQGEDIPPDSTLVFVVDVLGVG